VNATELQNLLSQPPASFQWSQSEDGTRTIGASEGCVIDLWPDRVEMAAVFPPDRADVAARNGALMALVLVALRKEWQTAGDWLAVQMRQAARAKTPLFETENYSRQVRFVFDRRHSRATLRIRWTPQPESH
jgi:hypothetical protein